MISETTKQKVDKIEMRNKLKKMIDDDTFLHFMVFSEMRAHNRGMIVGVVMTLIVFVVYSYIF